MSASSVLIQPSFGNAQARRNYAKTLEQPFPFEGGLLGDALAAEESEQLLGLHPGGSARFWATPRNQDKIMARLKRGDVVLFTGNKHVRAIGEVGLSFRNPAAGNAMWPPHKDHGPYLNVYSLISFQPVEIPYPDLRKLTDTATSKGGDNYMGARLYENERAERILDGLLIETATELLASDVLVDNETWHQGEVVAAEAHNTDTASGSAPARTFVADRAESRLVVAYKQFLVDSGDRRRQQRLKSKVGFSDLYLLPGAEGGITEIVEAKSSALHEKVREALAQLLDYVIHAHCKVDALTALFPERPSDRDIRWLGNYGIGCVYPTEATGFKVLAPPESRVPLMKSLWQPASDTSHTGRGLLHV
ncbi:hypothetical protein [Rhodococcus opacus]|uniref:hypothetical protein n=1 Tax=Rhodococcus opacus TaxID=37919 RepID=UPI0010EFBD1E|nr:hypothetical protein [Rhodococcus opacus]MDV7088620.1 hypothetical protein [Rhodococcus opacus]RYE42325.1 MAG: hypothetical protein EOP24_33180 [Hyphomicrobiales bacterium]